MASSDDVRLFLRDSLSLSDHSNRVHVTLTFAQSVDAKIAGNAGKQISLSCKESMQMTHWMRSMHDSILVGIGTALNDDPQLNTRLLPAGEHHPSPQPIILDSELRFRTDSKLLNNWNAGTGRQPIVFTRPSEVSDGSQHEDRRLILEKSGAIVKTVPLENGRLSLDAVLRTLSSMGFRSLMVEGGAAVIAAFLDSAYVDTLLITVSPKIIGSAGVGYECRGEQMSHLDFERSRLVGVDSVMVWKKRPEI